ncbi:MAG: adenylyltransferase/cytidyltransferase family protein [Candidatus Aenigmarchaeota archaeon]|nr:adenylyltransferase/cytidyltransferase family protein [Candidatus Aenigmarchaeota archaeon]
MKANVKSGLDKLDKASRLVKAGRPVRPAVKVMVGGKFNIIHPGHIWFLRKARAFGDELVVVLASDATIRNNGQPLVFPAKERKRVMESLSLVDRVLIGDEKDFFRVVEKERPDVIVLGYDQQADSAWLKKRLHNSKKPRIIILKKWGNYSTSSIIEMMGRGKGAQTK